MDKKYACYCVLYCENCAVKVKVEPAAKTLLNEMTKLGFGEIISFFPNGEKFWEFLKNISTKGICTSCKEGSGNPACKVKLCAKEKNIEMCAFCKSYPCEFFNDLFEGYPMLKHDNWILKEKGWRAWEKTQAKYQTEGVGFSYTKTTEKSDKNIES